MDGNLRQEFEELRRRRVDSLSVSPRISQPSTNNLLEVRQTDTSSQPPPICACGQLPHSHIEYHLNPGSKCVYEVTAQKRRLGAAGLTCVDMLNT